MSETQVIQIVEIVIGLLFIASLVAIAVQRLRMPYTVGLVLVGLGLAVTVGQFPGIANELENIRGLILPELILAILVPPLIFEAAFHMHFDDLKRNLRTIITFAIPGVILTMVMVAGITAWGTTLSIEMALVFGALIAATDPVAVVALFRTLGVPKRLQTLLEGESLFNDGTAIVIYNLMIVIALGISDFDPTTLATSFVRIAIGGLIVGGALAVVISFVIKFVDDHLIEITLTTIGAYGSYLVAENFHVSGVLAVVAAGMVMGNIGPSRMSPTTRISLNSFWEYAAFLANSIVFLLIGIVIDLTSIMQNSLPILLAIGAVLLARAVVIYLFSRLQRDIPIRIQHVLFWGGLRGAISLALALSLPQTLVELAEINNVTPELLASMEAMALVVQDMTFGVVLFTLLVQGTSMGPIVRRLGLSERNPAQEAFQHRQAQAVGAQAAYSRVQEMFDKGLISEHVWRLLEPRMGRIREIRTDAVRKIMNSDRSLEVAQLNSAYREGLRAQRLAFSSLLESRVISEDIFQTLVAEVDTALDNQDIRYGDLLLRRPEDQPPITRMLIANVDDENLQNTLSLLNILGIPTTHFDSTIGPRGISINTLLIGIEAHQEDEVVEAIIGFCTEEFDQPSVLLGITGSDQPLVANRALYGINIDHFEEF